MSVVFLHNTIETMNIIGSNNVDYEDFGMEYIVLRRAEYERIAETTNISRYLVV